MARRTKPYLAFPLRPPPSDLVAETPASTDTACSAHGPVLTIDETTAHILISGRQADELLAWFHGESLACVLRRGAGVRGLDVLDFGDPSPAQESRIRATFAAWRQRLG